ncbi:MAG: hypothetical protein U9O98_10320, partial [Asgard group archaeon]|nr:hypothetical protein [Asgard group archaeon]
MLSCFKRIKSVTRFFLFLSLIILPSSFLIQYNNSKENFSPKRTNQNFDDKLFIPQQFGEYYADINWVATNISLNKRGDAEVSILVNCTTLLGHFGIYLRQFEEKVTINTANTYALYEEEKLDINITSSGVRDVSYLLYLKN